jgi:sec-independent protein translocase protein TatA
MEIALIVGAAVLLFGADKLPKLARSAGQAKKEFMVGQAEADVAADKVREEARLRAEANAAAAKTADPVVASEAPAAPAPSVPPASTPTTVPPSGSPT